MYIIIRPIQLIESRKIVIAREWLECIFVLRITGSINPAADVQSVMADSPWDGAFAGPSFDSSQPEAVTVSVGQTAYLACRVRQLGDRKVSLSLQLYSLRKHAYVALRTPFT